MSARLAVQDSTASDDRHISVKGTQNALHALQYRWNPDSLSVEVISTSSGSGSEVTVTNTPAVTIADGSDAAQGATTDAESVGNGSVIAILKRIRTLLGAALTTNATIQNASLVVAQLTYSTSTVTQVASSATNVQVLASTAGRKGASFFNDSTQVCYLKLGTTATSSSYTVKMAAGDFYEAPFPCYTGRIDAIWASANGNMFVTELT